MNEEPTGNAIVSLCVIVAILAIIVTAIIWRIGF